MLGGKNMTDFDKIFKELYYEFEWLGLNCIGINSIQYINPIGILSSHDAIICYSQTNNGSFLLKLHSIKDIFETLIKHVTIENISIFYGVTIYSFHVKVLPFPKPDQIKKCLGCGNNFEKKHKSRLYCSKKCKERVIAKKYRYTKKINKFESKLSKLFDCNQLESGFIHESEKLIESEFSKHIEFVEYWFKKRWNKIDDDFKEKLIRCIGKLPFCLVSAYVLNCIEKSMYNENIEIRDAAVNALEMWGNEESVNLLRNHKEMVPWLKCHINRVINEI